MIVLRSMKLKLNSIRPLFKETFIDVCLVRPRISFIALHTSLCESRYSDTRLFPHSVTSFFSFQRTLLPNWWRGQDLNLRPSGYEPDEIPTSPPRVIESERGCNVIAETSQHPIAKKNLRVCHYTFQALFHEVRQSKGASMDFGVVVSCRLFNGVRPLHIDRLKGMCAVACECP